MSRFFAQYSSHAFSAALIGLVALAMASTQASALTNYADAMGTSFNFTNMSEDTTTAGDPDPIFGAPTIVGDALIFSPTGFASNASGGASDQTNGTFTLNISSKDKDLIAVEQVNLTELGDFSLGGAGTAGTDASALAGLFVTVTEINLNGALTIAVLPTSVTDFVNFNTPVQAGDWTLSANIDVTTLVQAAFGANAFATEVIVTWNNDLATNSEVGTTSQIQKKIGIPSVTVTVIPEPGTALLVGLGLTALGARRRN